MRTLAVGGLITGCGKSAGPRTQTTSSKADYVESFKTTVAAIDEGPKIEAPAGASPEQEGVTLEKGVERLRRLAAQLSILNPPAEIRSAHEQFVAGLREIADQAEKAATALKAGDQAAARKLLNTFADPATVAKIAAARRAFASKGYDLGAIDTSP